MGLYQIGFKSCNWIMNKVIQIEIMGQSIKYILYINHKWIKD